MARKQSSIFLWPRSRHRMVACQCQMRLLRVLRHNCSDIPIFSIKNNVAWCPHNKGVTTGVQGSQFPGRRVTMGAPNHCGPPNGCGGAPKSPNNVTSTFFNTVHLLPKGLRFEHGSAKVASCPGRHITSLRPYPIILVFITRRICSIKWKG